MSSLVLYKFDASPPACAVRILGDMLGLQFQYLEPDLMTMEHKSPEYMKLNPMGTIPTLLDGDFVLSESNAIMGYLLGKYGGDKLDSLYPSDVNTRAIVDQCLYFNAGVFFIRLKVVALPTIYEGLKGPTEKHLKDIETAFRVVESYLQRHQYIAADHLTIADLAVGTTANALKEIYKPDANTFPLTTAWLERLLQEATFRKYSVPGAARLGTVLNAFWERNNKQ